MPYLTTDDYKSQIKDSVLATVLESNDALRVDAEQKAMAQIKSRLNVRYDVAAELLKTAGNRNSEIVMYMIDMTLYHLHSRINPGQVPENRKERYGDALTWLDKCARGEYDPGLPPKGDANNDGVDDGSEVQYGSRTARDTYY